MALIFSSAVILAPLPLYASTPDIAGEDTITAAEMEPDYQNDLFPEPESLRPNVNFWIDVYTKYDENQAIIHDNTNLDIRYEVVNLDEAYPRASRRYAARQLTLRKRQIAEMLNRLALREGRCETDGECRIASFFGNTADAGVYRAAADQLRVQYGLKSRFKQGLVTSGQYMPEMKKIFDRYGVPLDLLALPHVESSFNVKAYSRVGAAGIWQFMRSTGRHYLKINGQTDERRDPLIATEGAAKFLRDNYQTLQSWPLVVTSYNHGKNGMAHAKRIHGDDIAEIIANYDGRAFGFASRNFYCEFLAARRIMQNPEQYFGSIDFHSPLEFDMVKLQHHVRISDMARHYDLHEIARLNPALQKSTLSGGAVLPRGWALRVPRGTAEAFTQVKPYNPTPEELEQAVPARMSRSMPGAHKDFGTITAAGEYVVDSGDSLYSIAMKYNTTVAALKELNGMGRRSRIFPSQKLVLPPGAVSRIAPPAPPPAAVASVTPPPQPAKEPAPPQIARKERSILADYAALFAHMANRVTMLAGWNGAPTSSVQVALSSPSPAPAATQTAATPVPPPAPQPVTYPIPLPEDNKFRFKKTKDGYGVITVLPEETVNLYANWAGVSTRDVMRLNKWRHPRLQLWASVKIPLDKAGAEVFEKRRIGFHQGLYHDFFGSHHVTEVDDRVLHRGQTAWTIWNGRREVPLWLISLYNDGKRLDRLHAGDVIRVPVIEKKAF